MTGEMMWHSLRYLPLSGAGLIALVCLVLWFYPPQVRFISRPWRWVLPSLRIMALSALAISVLKPVVTRARESDDRDALVVLIDRSRSMSVHDTSRTPAEWVALADGLGMLPDDIRDDPTEGMAAVIAPVRTDAEQLHSARIDEELTRFDEERATDARIKRDQTNLRYKTTLSAMLLRSEMYPNESPIAIAIAELNQVDSNLRGDAWIREIRSHLDRVESAQAEMRAAADAELYASNAQVKTACDELAAFSRLDLARMGLNNRNSGLLRGLDRSLPVQLFTFAGEATPLAGDDAAVAALEADGLSTEIAGAIRSAAAQLRGNGVAGFVVLSDGYSTTGGMESISTLAPVYAVNVAPKLAGRDVGIARVNLPSRQFIGETMPVRVDLRNRGFAGSVVDVKLLGDGIEQSQRLTLPEDSIVPVEFSVKLKRAPVQRLAISVSDVPGEITTENNHVERWVKVTSERLNIAAYSGSPSWDFQYLRNTLSRTPWVNLEEAILPSEAVKPALSPEQILEQDVIILHDLAVASLTGEQWTAVHQLVTERGGSLILVAGDAHLPAEYGHNEILASFLPYRGGLKPVWRIWPGQTPSFQMIPAPGTEAIDALRLSDDAVEGRQRWNVLPGWFRYLSIAELKSNTTPLLIERDSGAPVLTESRLGLGRVMFFGGNETWRWRYKVGEALQDRFWLQLIRYAAGEPYAVSVGGASLDLDQLSIEPGANVRARARVRDGNGAPSKLAEQTLQVFRAGEEIRRQVMSGVGGEGSGRYETMIAYLPEGAYQVKLSPTDFPDASVELDLHVAASIEAEMAEVAGDESRLRRMAQVSGGEYLPIERIGELPELISSREMRRTIVAEYPLWDSPYLFVFVVACLGAEWALRKAVGLA